ncbi:MAG: hypothetical protein ABI113_15665 [Mucilaginibacter sp.]
MYEVLLFFALVGVVTNKTGCSKSLLFAKKLPANSPHNVIGFVGDDTNNEKKPKNADYQIDAKVTDIKYLIMSMFCNVRAVSRKNGTLACV